MDGGEVESTRRLSRLAACSGATAIAPPTVPAQAERGADGIGVARVGSVWGNLILPPGALVIGNVDAEDRRCAALRKRKLDPEQEHAIRVAAVRGSTLRALAIEQGVSHQTVARIVHETHPDGGISSLAWPALTP